jgi:hypothetical protein
MRQLHAGAARSVITPPRRPTASSRAARRPETHGGQPNPVMALPAIADCVSIRHQRRWIGL